MELKVDRDMYTFTWFLQRAGLKFRQKKDVRVEIKILNLC